MAAIDEEIKQRIEMDDDAMQSAYFSLAQGVSKKPPLDEACAANLRIHLRSVIGDVLAYYRIQNVQLPDDLKDIQEAMSILLNESGMMRRSVELAGAWYKNATGVLLAQFADGTPVALLPHGLRGYMYRDPKTGGRIRLTKKTAALLQKDATAFSKPLLAKKIRIRDLSAYIFQSLSAMDLLFLAVTTLLATLIGLIGPYANKILFSNVAKSNDINALVMLTVLLAGVTVSLSMIGIGKTLLLNRLETRSGVAVAAAMVSRLLMLPVDFFKQYSSGNLSSRIDNVNSLCQIMINALLSIGITAVFSLIYFGQIFRYAPALLWPALAVILATLFITMLTLLLGVRNSRKVMEAQADSSGEVFSLLSGLQKIKLAGAEKRAFLKWALTYANVVKARFNPPLLLKLNTAIAVLVPMAGSIVLYYAAVRAHVPVADYMAFNASYALVSGAVVSLSAVMTDISKIQPMMKIAGPILDSIPEGNQCTSSSRHISGSIEMDNVRFRYSDRMPLVINDLTLKINPGEYVALVGKTGCGKSTIFRLLLGFEKPQSGGVYYDGRNINTFDLRQLRRSIGVVLQDGKIFSGTIYDNIVITAPWLTVDDAWEAAELAGIADEIRSLPMGMNTLLSENSVGISGGQRQRLMIARAIAPKPSIMMFDEATSALDNIVQSKISKALDSLKSTRIVIAHRLSTIQQCDRILLIENGTVAQEGTYRELIAKPGLFADLVYHQQLNPTGQASV